MTAGLLRPSPDGAVRASLIGSTPIVEIGVELPGITGEVRTQPVYLKIEAANPFGSIKDRTAYALVRSLELRGELAPGSRIIESTSGNLGVALAAIAAERGYRFVAVVDPKISGPTLGRLQDLGADVEMVGEADTTGNYLLARLARVRQLREQHRELAWTAPVPEPGRPAGPFRADGPRATPPVWRPAGDRVRGRVDGRHAGRNRPLPPGRLTCNIGRGRRRARISAVGCSFGTRLLNGIGSSQRSAFLVPGLYDRVELVPDPEAITTSTRRRRPVCPSAGRAAPRWRPPSAGCGLGTRTRRAARGRWPSSAPTGRRTTSTPCSIRLGSNTGAST